MGTSEVGVGTSEGGHGYFLRGYRDFRSGYRVLLNWGMGTYEGGVGTLEVGVGTSELGCTHLLNGYTLSCKFIMLFLKNIFRYSWKNIVFMYFYGNHKFIIFDYKNTIKKNH